MYRTKPQIAVALLQRAVQRGSLPFQWVAADELYGDSPVFRDAVAGMHKWYFVEVRPAFLVWRRRPATAYQRRNAVAYRSHRKSRLGAIPVWV